MVQSSKIEEDYRHPPGCSVRKNHSDVLLDCKDKEIDTDIFIEQCRGLVQREVIYIEALKMLQIHIIKDDVHGF